MYHLHGRDLVIRACEKCGMPEWTMARLWFLRLPGSEVPKAIFHFSFWPVVRRASRRPAFLRPGRSIFVQFFLDQVAGVLHWVAPATSVAVRI